jgi:proteic killer suppression protein
MIVSFACKETERLFGRIFSRKLPQDIQERAYLKLMLLHRTSVLDHLRIPPSNRLEALKGNRRGQYSIRINNQWRLCFEFHQGDAHHVEIVDYH